MHDELAKHGLPPELEEIDISDLVSVEPPDLILSRVEIVPDTLAAGRAILYARAGSQVAYDAIGFRTFAASPHKGPSPLQTSAWSAMQRDLVEHKKKDTLADEVLRLQPKLRHRPLALPTDGLGRYAIDRDVMHWYRRKTDAMGREVEDRWTFSLTDLPEAFLMGAADRDEPMIAAQRLVVGLQGTHWLPFSVLLADGRFRRFQDVRSLLVGTALPRSFYCFLSHRWLDPKHPDPEGHQAQFAAWQLVAYLAEAVRVADQRGLHQSRRFSPQLGRAVGPRGTDLAESLIVNVLRFALDADKLREAAAETLPLEPVLDDYGVANAAKDAGLGDLNRLLADRPILRSLIDHVYLWYDYSCLPQPPREADDADLFVKGLEELPAAQSLGRTAIMLDDADDYLSRGWCTLEALVADTSGGATDLLVGSARPSVTEGEVEYYFETLLEDRPHVVWRAILDTEVFGVQSPATCMERLGLDVTDPDDLPFIYQRLRGLPAPAKIHVDDSEIVTGILPLPAFENGAFAVRVRHSGRSFSPDEQPVPTTTLNWRDALFLASAWRQGVDSVAATPPFCSLPVVGIADGPSCHVAVIGACEGEAILLANWVRRNRAELESLLSVSVTSISWVASDIAPIGQMAVGSLRALPVTTAAWVVVATSARLQHCRITSFLTETLKWAGVGYATIAIDQLENNVAIPEPPELPEEVDINELIVAVDLAKNPPRTHPGGLFQWQIEEALL